MTSKALITTYCAPLSVREKESYLPFHICADSLAAALIVIQASRLWHFSACLYRQKQFSSFLKAALLVVRAACALPASMGPQFVKADDPLREPFSDCAPNFVKIEFESMRIEKKKREEKCRKRASTSSNPREEFPCGPLLACGQFGDQLW